MPKGKPQRSYRRKGGQAKIKDKGIWVDCTGCGGGTNRCNLCRATGGKVKVIR